ncbi:hypothetical protein [Paenibacillus chungangensis]|uniref:Uncharacterized protein n=1 Tax=Paenibacillus chungangensis TaxID=696535 RepID=A0ABW3HKS7_9BACL
MKERTFYPQEYMDDLDMALTEDGYWGYPELATEEKGEKLVELLEECALAYIANIEEKIGKLGGRQSSFIDEETSVNTSWGLMFFFWCNKN